MEPRNDRRLSDNPIVVILGIVSSLLAIFIFVTGNDNLSMLLEQTRKNNPSTKTPLQNDPNDVILLSTGTSIPFQSSRGKVAFLSTRDGKGWTIYIMNQDGTNVTKLYDSALDSGLAWSSDGQKIAFTGMYAEIWVMNADGSGLTQLTNTQNFNEDPSWSPDGLEIAFSSTKGINVINIGNGSITHLTSIEDIHHVDGSPRWSPDGQHIVFVSDRDDNSCKCTSSCTPPDILTCDFDIYLMNIDGSGLTRLTSNPSSENFPSWSPDGKKIAFVSDRDGNEEIYVMNIDGSNVKRLTNNLTNDRNPTWSPDGKQIAFQSGDNDNWEIYKMNADGSQRTNLTNNIADDHTPAWSPLQ